MIEEYKNKDIEELRNLKYSLPELNIDPKIFENLKNNLKIYEENLKKAVNSFQKTLDVIKNRNPIFVNEDWYLSEDIWMKFTIPELYSISPLKLENLLFKEFEKEKINIKNRIIQNHNERLEIIEEVFESYEKKHYYSVVILSYSIIDGFSRKNYGI